MNAPAPGSDPRPLGGEPISIDLLNTAWNGAAGVRDLLEEPGGVDDWLAATGLADSSPATEATRRALRSTRAALRAVVHEPHAAAARDALNEILARGTLVRELAPGGPATRIRVADPAWRAAWLVADDFLRLLERPDRIRQCAHPHCVLHFYDTSPKGNRRWCSMAGCGNRAKAARHYVKSKGEPERSREV